MGKKDKNPEEENPILKIIESSIDRINSEIKQYNSLNYHFKFVDFKYESDEDITLCLSILAVSNKDKRATVTLMEERTRISCIETTLSVFDIVALRKQQILIRFVESMLRILLLGVNSPLIIMDVDKALIESEDRWESVTKKLEE
jgi:hypothetical protein